METTPRWPAPLQSLLVPDQAPANHGWSSRFERQGSLGIAVYAISGSQYHSRVTIHLLNISRLRAAEHPHQPNGYAFSGWYSPGTMRKVIAIRFHPLMVMIASVRFTNSSSEKLSFAFS